MEPGWTHPRVPDLGVWYLLLENDELTHTFHFTVMAIVFIQMDGISMTEQKNKTVFLLIF